MQKQNDLQIKKQKILKLFNKDNINNLLKFQNLKHYN